MEIAKFILTAIGTFLSVFSLTFAVIQYWKKKQDEKFDSLKKAVAESVQNESHARENAVAHLEKRIEFLEHSVVHGFENRLSVIEGELKGIKPILQAIQNWFINNTPAGRKKG